jgi:hypothetical protein
MEILFIASVIFLIVVVVHYFTQKKIPNNTVIGFTGALGSGKSYIGVHQALKHYSSIRKLIFFRLLKVKVKPVLLSNIPILSYEKLKQLMNEHDPNFEYTTMTLNKNFQCTRHIDSNNVGESYIIGFGNYKGGELNIENVKFDIKHKFHKFNGSELYHWVEPWTDGDRYSVVYYKNFYSH